MALVEENTSFTLTRQYHNLYIAKWKVFSVYGNRQQSQLLLRTLKTRKTRKEKHLLFFFLYKTKSSLKSQTYTSVCLGAAPPAGPSSSVSSTLFYLSNTLKPCNRQ